MFERDAWGVIRRRRTERVCSCVFVCVCPCPWVYACEKFWAFVHVSVYVWACVLSLPVHWAAAVLVHALCCPGFGPTEHNVWSEGERRWEKAERGVGGGLHGGGCLSLWIGSGWFTSSGHWWLPLPCCKTSSCGPAWTLGALCPTLAGNMPPKVLLPPTTTVHPQHLQSFALSISLHPFHPCSSTALCQPQAGGEGNKT